MKLTVDKTNAWYEERFNLLVMSGQANDASVSAAKFVLEMVEKAYGVPLGEESGASLATHLATTLKKLLARETLIQAPEEVWQELQGYPEEVELAGRIVEQLESTLNISLARDELGFIAVHLCKIRLELGQESGR